jgi:hypothetical protein
MASLKPAVREERTHWRDQALSERHRLYGWDAPAVDIDLLLIEYSTGTPAALIEYKLQYAKQPNLEHPSYRALKALADSSQIPFLVVFYNHENWAYEARPANEYAKKYVPETTIFCEWDFVKLLYRMRGLTAPFPILLKLSANKGCGKTAIRKTLPVAFTKTR